MILIVVACCLASASAAKYCCPPDQWEGDEGMVFGFNSAAGTYIVDGMSRVSVDAVNMRTAARQQLVGTDGTVFNQSLIYDYKKMIVYYTNSTSCTQHTYGGQTNPCIPDNAEETDFHLGLGDNTVAIRNFHVVYADYELYMGVTADTCVPVMYVVSGERDGVKSFSTSTYSNIRAGIADTSVFNVPAGCDQGPVLPRLPGAGSRRSLHGF